MFVRRGFERKELNAMGPAEVHDRHERHPWLPRHLAVAAVFLLAGSLAVAPPARARPRPAIVAHGHRFVPDTGNWDGSAPGGFAASFELGYKPSNAIFGSPYSYGDLLTFTPSFSPSPTGCPVAAESTAYGVVGEGALFALKREGGFGLTKSDLFGGIVGSTRAVLTQREQWPPGAEFAQCPRSITWTFHPAPRRSVRDGSWALHLRGGETQMAKVLGGGRALNSVALPNVGECGGGLGSVTLFISADGVAKFSEPGAITSVTITFDTPTSANGEISEATATCGVEKFPLIAMLTKPER